MKNWLASAKLHVIFLQQFTQDWSSKRFSYTHRSAVQTSVYTAVCKYSTTLFIFFTFQTFFTRNSYSHGVVSSWTTTTLESARSTTPTQTSSRVVARSFIRTIATYSAKKHTAAENGKYIQIVCIFIIITAASECIFVVLLEGKYVYARCDCISAQSIYWQKSCLSYRGSR